VAQFLPDTWLTRHRKGGSAAPEYSSETAVVHNNDWYNQELNTVYHEMAEHYNTAIIPARVRAPKDYRRKSVIGNLSLKSDIYG
jgi:hypothetical protein